MANQERESAVKRLEAALAEQDRVGKRFDAAVGTSTELGAYVELGAAGEQVRARQAWADWVDDEHYRGINAGPFELLGEATSSAGYGEPRDWRPEASPYAAAVQALLENGPLKGKAIEVEAVEGRPPKTIDVPDEKGLACRYCLAEWTQEGMTAAYTFLYTV
jgi:hypothetical protein